MLLILVEIKIWESSFVTNRGISYILLIVDKDYLISIKEYRILMTSINIPII